MKIEAAACRHNGVTFYLPAPKRHHHILYWMDTEKNIGTGYGHYVEQGFITDEGNYVDRREGARIALKAGQIEELQWPPYLYSEDLW